MIRSGTATVYRGGRKRRLTLRAACMDAAREMVRRAASASGDDLTHRMQVEHERIRRVANYLERRFRRSDDPHADAHGDVPGRPSHE